MEPNTVVGLENVTWRCNMNCKHCFFRFFPQLHSNIDTPIEQLRQSIKIGKDRGCTSVTLTGHGEPTLHPQINEIIRYSSQLGMESLIITNGITSTEKYKELYNLGLDHLQISVHGLGETLDKIAERKDAGKKQMKLLEWLYKEKKAFRVTITIQLLNSCEIFDIVKKVVQLGAFHISLLNFLPHYKMIAHTKAVAVNPIKLVDIFEKSMEYMEGKVIFTNRYFPMCLLKPKFWKYITNAQFVLFDPWEWDYQHLSPNIENVWKYGLISRDAVGIKGKPCNACLLREHCGGWNRFYAEAFNYEGLNAIKVIPNNLKIAVSQRGGLFDLNPANKGRDVTR